MFVQLLMLPAVYGLPAFSKQLSLPNAAPAVSPVAVGGLWRNEHLGATSVEAMLMEVEKSTGAESYLAKISAKISSETSLEEALDFDVSKTISELKELVESYNYGAYYADRAETDLHMEKVDKLLKRGLSRTQLMSKLSKFDRQRKKKSKKLDKLRAKCDNDGRRRVSTCNYGQSPYSPYGPSNYGPSTYETGTYAPPITQKRRIEDYVSFNCFVKSVAKQLQLVVQAPDSWRAEHGGHSRAESGGKNFVRVAGQKFKFDMMTKGNLKDLLELQAIDIATFQDELSQLRKKNKKGKCD